MQSSIQAVIDRLNSAKSFIEIFGKPPTKDKKEQVAFVKKQFAFLAQVVHPDHAHGYEKLAGEAFHLLDTFWKAAQKAITDGNYDKTFAPKEFAAADVTLTSTKSVYRIFSSLVLNGNFSLVYRGVDSGGKNILAKISSLPENNVKLEYEAKILKRFAGDKLSKFVPEILDSFIVPDGKGKQFRVAIMKQPEGYFSLEEIRKKYKNGVNPPEAAWIIRRVIGQALAAKHVQVVHASIVPDHVLVHPVTHDPIHLGWVHAVDVKSGKLNRVMMIVDRWKDWYPPEVFDKKPATEKIDLYQIGKTAIYLLGGDVAQNKMPNSVPKEVGEVILSCVNKDPNKRPKSAHVFLEEFTSIIRKVWGKSYKILEM